MKILVREFIAQFFIGESATSDHAVRQAIIGVIAFLLTPGFLMPIQLSGPFEFAAIRFPEMLTPLIQLMATIFITYGVVSIGVIAAFAWDGLGFDKRDAMVLGPLPLRGTTIITAKLAALSALLLTAAALMSLLTAVPFALVASNHTGATAAGRHFAAHMVATMCATTTAFCVLVTVRSLVGMIGVWRESITSFVQFTLVSALLCFVVLAPAGLDVVHGRRGAARVFIVRIPEWSPTNWFLGLYETVRGTGGGEFWAGAAVAIEVTAASIAVAILATIHGYRRQMQLALAPSGSASTRGAARVRRAIGRAIAGRDRVARATVDFILTTLARNRAQQAPIAINTAVGLAIAVAGLVHRGGGLSALMRPRTVVLWIPLLLAYWATIGLRASFFVPSELPAAWTFRANAPMKFRAYWSAVRASLIAFIVPPAVALALALAPLVGWHVAAWHAAITGVVLILLCEVVALTINFIPFTRPYSPGHAKLKGLWPVYAFGIQIVAYFPVQYELRRLNDPSALLRMIGWFGAAIVVCEIAGRWRARSRSVAAVEDTLEDASAVTVLNLGTA